MKKILLIALAVTFCGTLKAQYNYRSEPSVRYGIKSGVSLFKQSMKSGDITVPTDYKPSFYVGVFADIYVNDQLSFQPGLTYINKGSKMKSDMGTDIDFDDLGNFDDLGDLGDLGGIIDMGGMLDGLLDGLGAMDSKTTLSYLELPLNLVGNFEMGNGKLVAGGGPYFAYGISGTSKVFNIKADVEFGSGEEQVKKIDYGVNLLLGYEFSNGFSIHSGYSYGINNISNASDIKVKNSGFNLGLGFKF